MKIIIEVKEDNKVTTYTMDAAPAAKVMAIYCSQIEKFLKETFTKETFVKEVNDLKQK